MEMRQGLNWNEPIGGTEQMGIHTSTCFLGGSLPAHGAVSCLLAEFDIWYNESFIIPEDMQVALKLGGSIRPGMVPVNRLVSLVSDQTVGVW
jgi:hypothetical protein